MYSSIYYTLCIYYSFANNYTSTNNIYQALFHNSFPRITTLSMHIKLCSRNYFKIKILHNFASNSKLFTSYSYSL